MILNHGRAILVCCWWERQLLHAQTEHAYKILTDKLYIVLTATCNLFYQLNKGLTLTWLIMPWQFTDNHIYNGELTFTALMQDLQRFACGLSSGSASSTDRASACSGSYRSTREAWEHLLHLIFDHNLWLAYIFVKSCKYFWDPEPYNQGSQSYADLTCHMLKKT